MARVVKPGGKLLFMPGPLEPEGFFSYINSKLENKDIVVPKGVDGLYLFRSLAVGVREKSAP